MTNFNFTARDKSGAMQRGSLTAEDRSSALVELRNRDLVPIAVEEGKVKSDSGPRDQLSKQTIFVVVGALVVVFAVFFAWQSMSAKKRETPQKKAPAEKVVKAAKPSPAPAANVVAKPLDNPIEPPKTIVEVPAVRPKEIQGIVPPKADMITALRKPSTGDRVLVPGLHSSDTNAPNPYATFRTRSERMISMIINSKPGEQIIGVAFGRDFDKDFAASLENIIEIYPTDTEEMAVHKEEVAKVKDEMRKLAKEGQSPEEILTTYRDQHNEVAQFRSELQRQLSALKQEGKMGEAEAFAKEANKMLEPYGTKPLVAFPVFPKPKNKQ